MKASSLRRHSTIHPSGQGVVLSALNPAYRSGRTIFPSRVFDVDEVQRVLKTGHQSRKIGEIVAKGHLKGCPIFMLTLEERATCPRGCGEWGRCYGNNMQGAERIVAGPALEAAIIAELAQLQADYPLGFLVRLHVLGDFYSVAYVDMWRDALNAFPALHIFGFTARDEDGEIGARIALVTAEYGWPRAAIRFSGASRRSRAARVKAIGEIDLDAVHCPAQTGATDCCATCALCWQSDRSIAFARH